MLQKMLLGAQTYTMTTQVSAEITTVAFLAWLGKEVSACLEKLNADGNVQLMDHCLSIAVCQRALHGAHGSFLSDSCAACTYDPSNETPSSRSTAVTLSSPQFQHVQ